MKNTKGASGSAAALAAAAVGAGLLAGGLLVNGRVDAAPTGQTQGAVLTAQKKPEYPESLAKALRQGNVLILGRVNREGRAVDLHAITASHKDFVKPAVDAVGEWRFKPAMRDGVPVEVFLNAAVRFRLQGENLGDIGLPVLGDLSVFPADGQGKKTAPDGFPIRRGKDPALRAEAVLDVPAKDAARTLTIKVEAVSPSQRHVPIFQPPVQVPAKATEVRIPIVAQIGSDWEEGVWLLRFLVDGNGAGGGQFWLADDPGRFEFHIPSTSPASTP